MREPFLTVSDRNAADTALRAPLRIMLVESVYPVQHHVRTAAPTAAASPASQVTSLTVQVQKPFTLNVYFSHKKI